ncbi:MAG: hypothetical protein EOP04_21770, partial [Proteobacteria bacterium]
MHHDNSIFPRDHRVFSGGRYLRAFDHLPDISAYEHSILTYLGSLMSFEESYLDQPAFPSVAAIAVATKISEATVRTKMRVLERKGYIRVEGVLFINARGKMQQSTNNYYFSEQSFELFESILDSQEIVRSEYKRAVGDSFHDGNNKPFSYSYARSPETSKAAVVHEKTAYVCTAQIDPIAIPEQAPLVLEPTVKSAPPSQSAAPSPPRSQTVQPEPWREPSPKFDGDMPRTRSFAPPTAEPKVVRDVFTKRGEVNRIIAAWEDITKRTVLNAEREGFFMEYIRIERSEIPFMEKLLLLSYDPSPLAKTKSMFILFTDIVFEPKKVPHVEAAPAIPILEHKAPEVLETKKKDELPLFIQTKTRNFSSLNDSLLRHLLTNPNSKKEGRLKKASDENDPKTKEELTAAIEFNSIAAVNSSLVFGSFSSLA